jgi:hypothetical protein
MATAQGHTPDPRSAPVAWTGDIRDTPSVAWWGARVALLPSALRQAASARVGLETSDRFGAKDCAPTGVLAEKLYSSFAAAACSMIDVFKCRARP